MEPTLVRKLAREFALKAVKKQRADLQRWGIMADWDEVYLTLDNDYIVRQLQLFHQFIKQGYVYRQFRPVYWSPSTGTALAESELEYEPNHLSHATYVRCLITHHTLDHIKEPLYGLVWTTTPWTLPANQALSVNPTIKYALVKKDSELYVVAKNLVGTLSETLDSKLELIQDGIMGSELEGWEYLHPMNKELCQKILLGDFVTDKSGTGLVHCAPAHGMEDYLLCKKHNIFPRVLVNGEGKFNEEAGIELAGAPVLTEGTQLVLKRLGANLILVHDHRHSYPYDWRSKQPVLQLATAQWFADLTPITGPAIDGLSKVQAYPKSGINRLTKFLTSRSEWCISRQRSWGVPLPIFYHKTTDEPLLDDQVIEHIISVIDKQGIDSWWGLSNSELLPSNYSGDDYVRGFDTMDVWFDSGSAWTLTHTKYPRANTTIADVYLEGSDQHRGWFQSSLLTSFGATGRLPFSTLITHGFLLDGNHIKMSKSLGNVIEPSLIVDGGPNKKLQPSYGADGLRGWVASCDYTTDISISPTSLNTSHQIYSKLRNTLRFLIGNLHEFHPPRDLQPITSLSSLDRYILHELHHLARRVTHAYDEFNFVQATTDLTQFASVTLSSLYFDITKDRLYLEPRHSVSRLSCQSVMYHVLITYLQMLSPVFIHTVEEVMDHIQFLFVESNNNQKQPIVTGYQLGWPDLARSSHWTNESIANDWNSIISLRSHCNQLITKFRDAKLIASSAEANLVILLPPHTSHQPLREFLTNNQLDIQKALLISSLTIQSNQDLEFGSPVYDKSSFQTSQNCELKLNGQSYSIQLVIKPANQLNQVKCPRCWLWSTSQHLHHLCSRCESVVG